MKNYFKRNSFTLATLALIAFCTTSTPAHAISLYGGGLIGMDRISKSNSTLAAFGLTAGVRQMLLGFGAYYLTAGKDSMTFGDATVKMRHTMVGVEPSIFLGDIIIGRAGLKMGLNKTSREFQVGGVTFSDDSSDFSIGPSFGLDIQVAPFISVGAEFSHLRVTSSDSYGVTTFLGALKFWL